jgi:hypothetical protein
MVWQMPYSMNSATMDKPNATARHNARVLRRGLSQKSVRRRSPANNERLALCQDQIDLSRKCRLWSLEFLLERHVVREQFRLFPIRRNASKAEVGRLLRGFAVSHVPHDV